jgi:hypothetical protein
MKLNVKAFALAFGVIWGVNWFIVAWWMMAFDGITYEPTFLGQMYRGFNLSPLGSLVALGYGLIDGFMLGLLISLLYNWFTSHQKSTSDQE